MVFVQKFENENYFSFPQTTSQRHTMVPTYELDGPDQPFNATE
jgi:hypothetical protein